MKTPEYIISIETSYMFGEKGVEAEIKNCQTNKLRCLYSPNYPELFKGILDIFEFIKQQDAKAS